LSSFSLGARSSTNSHPSSGHLWFAPVIPRTGEAIFEANAVFRKQAKELNLPWLRFSLPTWFWQRTAIFIFWFAISEHPAQNRMYRDAFNRLIQLAAQHGWAEYRAAPAFQDAVMSTYSFNNNALLRFHEVVKDAVDPNGILSAGRYGIWPKYLRSSK
jgi:4-cresol dehydrogenase (hydroxylating)